MGDNRMASTPPIIKQIAWLSVVPQLAIGAVLVLAADLLGAGNPLLAAAVAYLALFFPLRWLVASHHRKGIALIKKQDFEPAIDEFQKSYRFFQNHPWVDTYRYVTLLSSSRMSYREMALVNIAFCHSQIGNGRESKEYYEKALAEFPESEIAKSALRMIAAAQELSQQ
ncbi:MAG: hypothetical protein OEN55_03715 [Alphaproteobacteria bacterium]|nr:hypothetical protein [Alphaproteobacteria bacterium]